MIMQSGTDFGKIMQIDEQFARFLERLSGNCTPEVTLAAKLVSLNTRQGHVCVDIAGFAGKPLPFSNNDPGIDICPALKKWRGILEASPVVGKPGDLRPLVLDERNRLYLNRYWNYENNLACEIRRRVQEIHVPDEGSDKGMIMGGIDGDLLRKGLSRLFPAGYGPQRMAALVAVLKPLVVITGSPGTGKTTVVAKILALLIEQAQGKSSLRFALTAPTGKAAARLQEAINKARENLACSESIRATLPEETFTIHRLLGAFAGFSSFRHNRANPLPYDVVVVDEASMVDLPLLAKLVLALPEKAKLILLGDKDQLASVEAGAVLGDICGPEADYECSIIMARQAERYAGMVSKVDSGPPDTGISDCIVSLKENFRFGEHSGISRLSAAVNHGDGSAALGVFASGLYEDIQWHDLKSENSWRTALAERVRDGFGDYLGAIHSGSSSPAAIMDIFDGFRVLCVLRQGYFGVNNLNELIENILFDAHLINSRQGHYIGRPVMITRNDYDRGLFNGDIGIILPDHEENGELRVYFRGAGGAIRRFHPLRLQEHETVYAMTVHKSQGSEFERVVMVLPDRDFPILTRELIYTGITRAKSKMEIWGDEEVFRTAVSRRIERTSGLREALWSCIPEDKG